MDLICILELEYTNYGWALGGGSNREEEPGQEGRWKINVLKLHYRDLHTAPNICVMHQTKKRYFYIKTSCQLSIKIQSRKFPFGLIVLILLTYRILK